MFKILCKCRFNPLTIRTGLFLIALTLLSACQSEFILVGSPELKSQNHTPHSQKPHSVKQQNHKPHTRGNKSPYVVFGKTYEVMPDSLGYREIGIASWYGKKFHGRLTSNGEVYDMYQLSAAHKSLPIPTQVKVTNLDNGKSVIVRVNDRGPFHDDRVIDLSYQTALALGFVNEGTAPVVVEAVDELNFPNREPESDPEHFYLQVGAFSKLTGAKKQVKEIKSLLAERQFQALDVNILANESDSHVLHRVWLGPISSESTRDQVIMLVQLAKLGNAIPVKTNRNH